MENSGLEEHEFNMVAALKGIKERMRNSAEFVKEYPILD